MPHQDPLATPTGVSVVRMATRAQSPFFVNAPPAVAAIAVEPLAPQHVTPPEADPDAERRAKISSVLTAPIQDL